MQPIKRWARWYDECVRCGTTEHKHKSRGVCTACYYREYERKSTRRRGNMERLGLDLCTKLRDLFRKQQIPLVVDFRDGKLTIMQRGKAIFEYDFSDGK